MSLHLKRWPVFLLDSWDKRGR